MFAKRSYVTSHKGYLVHYHAMMEKSGSMNFAVYYVVNPQGQEIHECGTLEQALEYIDIQAGQLSRT